VNMIPNTANNEPVFSITCITVRYNSHKLLRGYRNKSASRLFYFFPQKLIKIKGILAREVTVNRSVARPKTGDQNIRLAFE
jgi:hypothetical protein